MILRLAVIPNSQVLRCVKHGQWGSEQNRLYSWIVGEHLVTISPKIVALGKISGESFWNSEPIFEGRVYPFRIPVEFSNVVMAEPAITVGSHIKDLMREAHGRTWGRFVVNQWPINHLSRQILDAITTAQNFLDEVVNNLTAISAIYPDEVKASIQERLRQRDEKFAAMRERMKYRVRRTRKQPHK
jgi:hypothetical protein